MELQEFIETSLTEIIEAVENVRTTSKRDLKLTTNNTSNQTIQFDIAVSVEEKDSTETSGKLSGKGSIKVIGLNANVEENINNQNSVSKTSRIKFGVIVNTFTKDEEIQNRLAGEMAMSAYMNK